MIHISKSKSKSETQLMMKTTSKKQYHCNGCGLCRIGGWENFFHCNKCRCCYSVLLKNSHPCVEGAMHNDCPYLFESRNDVTVMPCGHTIHESCLKDMHEHYREMWDWHGEGYCLQKETNLDISPCLWDGVSQNEEDLSYMFDETTPVKACGDLAYHVADNVIIELQLPSFFNNFDPRAAAANFPSDKPCGGETITNMGQIGLKRQTMTHNGLRSLNKLDMLQMKKNAKAIAKHASNKNGPKTENDRPSSAIIYGSGMNIVFVGAEVGPWSKTGGLGDVLGGLPPAMAGNGQFPHVTTSTKMHGILIDQGR
ncbi:unnamed protein product [Camellia sinensis]